jgi:conjugative transposon TraK protein
MFTKTQNIEKAFKLLRAFAMTVIVGCFLLSAFISWKSYSLAMHASEKIYVLANGKAVQALSTSRRENIPVELRDHIADFHEKFFSLEPDEQVINTNLGDALYLADNTAKKQYEDLKEKGYYAGIISGNITQQIKVDSIELNTDSYPYSFKCFATQTIIRPTTVIVRSLVTEGKARTVLRSPHNSHGFLIENWQITDNSDVSIKNRE